jgi:hypothetical protein
MSGFRVDTLLLDCMGHFCKAIEPKVNNLPIWEAGGREVAAAKLKELGVSDQPVTMVQIARGLGILGKDPEVKENPSRKRRERV